MIRTVSLSLAVLALGACSTSGQIGLSNAIDPTNKDFGQSVRQNIAAQIVNPAPSTAPVEASGARVSKAVNAYQADKVEKPRPPGTTTVQAGGGGGGGNQGGN